ncbi:helix-turn-helix domain-containing protein [Peterkaempfera bronchialis]|uniref:helix-turn-helix domain-containing protein n=1 Tax=Peterkaempfera bronchialis TaxID=2126346 RepID=UPI0026B8D0C7
MSRRSTGDVNAAVITSAAAFGELLRLCRERAGLSQGDLASRLHCDRSLVCRIEAGTRVPQRTFAKTIDQHLGTGEILRELWQRIDWYPAGGIEHPDWFRQRAAMDAEATVLREYQTLVIPGLLQTEEYARAIFEMGSGNDIDERVRARLSRQQRFLNGSAQAPLLVAVLDESCLRTMVGDASVMRDQCAHLLDVGRLPSVCIQVAPADMPGLVRPKRPMSLIRLPDGHEWVYSESLERGHLNDDPAVISKHAQIYDVLRADTLNTRQSAEMIADVMKGYERHEPAGPERGDVGQEQLQRQRRRQLRRGGPRIHGHRPRPRQ